MPHFNKIPEEDANAALLLEPLYIIAMTQTHPNDAELGMSVREYVNFLKEEYQYNRRKSED